MAGKLTLILGGARSGKSRRAEMMASETAGEVLYVATAEPHDEEMRERIEAHRASRPGTWTTVEAPLQVGERIQRADLEPDVVLLDCITLLANNVFGPDSAEDPQDAPRAEMRLEREIDALLQAQRSSNAHWILVSNEVGLGIVPPYPLGRAYRDALGRANQRLAEAADEVLFMVAGLPMVVKEAGEVS